MMSSRQLTRSAALVVSLLLSGCVGGNQEPVPRATPDPVDDPVPEVSVAVGSAANDVGPIVDIDSAGYHLDPNGVLLAAIIILHGDVEEAVAAGLIRPVEVDVALLALSSGTLDDWVGFLGAAESAQVRPAIRAHSSRSPTVRWKSIGSR